MSKNQTAERPGIKSCKVLNWEKGHSEPLIESTPAIIRLFGYVPFRIGSGGKTGKLGTAPC